MRRFLIAGFLFLINIQSGFSQYILTQNCKLAYSAIWKYNLAEAENKLKNEQIANPGNLLVFYLYNTSRFIDAFATEDPVKYKLFKAQKDKQLQQVESNKKSPYYYFCKGEIYLHSAILKLKFGEYTTAAWEINKAYKTLGEGSEKYPDFPLLKRDLLMLQAIVGTVPDNYKWMLSILGFEGKLKPAMQQFSHISNSIKMHSAYKIFSPETQLIQAFLTQHLLNDPEQAWKLVNDATDGGFSNPVNAFALANMALRQKKNNEALNTLSGLNKNTPQIPHLDYMYGIAKLQRGDRDATVYLARYIRNYKGRNYVKDAYLKLGWAFLLNGDTENYKNSLKMIMKYGGSALEEDRNALKEAKKDKLPAISLLRARLFYDGGYYQKALEQLKTISTKEFNKNQLAEYYYRLARVQEASNNTADALINYGTLIEKFGGEEYFAPAACLYSGMIFEKQKNFAKAAYFYKKCIAYKGYVYKDSFDQKALAGLKRME